MGGLPWWGGRLWPPLEPEPGEGHVGEPLPGAGYDGWPCPPLPGAVGGQLLVQASELGSKRPAAAAARSRRTGTEVEVAIAPAQHSDDGRDGLCTRLLL